MQTGNFFHHQCGLFSSNFNFVSKRVDAPGKEPIIPAQGDSALIKKKIKFSSCIRKFRVEQLQSNIWLTASSYMGKYLRISSYIRNPFFIHIWLCNYSTMNSLYTRKFYFLFYQCSEGHCVPANYCTHLKEIKNRFPGGRKINNLALQTQR
jgi:hypothetical protein